MWKRLKDERKPLGEAVPLEIKLGRGDALHAPAPRDEIDVVKSSQPPNTKKRRDGDPASVSESKLYQSSTNGKVDIELNLHEDVGGKSETELHKHGLERCERKPAGRSSSRVTEAPLARRGESQL